VTKRYAEGESKLMESHSLGILDNFLHSTPFPITLGKHLVANLKYHSALGPTPTLLHSYLPFLDVALVRAGAGKL
jgi:hypothetical protein